MKIAILHQHFCLPTTGGPLRSYYLASALAVRGHSVVVFAAHNGPYHEESFEGIQICWLPVAYDNAYGFGKRSRSFLHYVQEVIRYFRTHRDCDLVYSISAPLTTGLAALWIRWRWRIPFLFEVGDLWPDAPIQLGIIKSRLFGSILYRLEKIIYSHSIGVVALSEPIRKAILSKIRNSKAVHLIPNVSDVSYYYLPDGSNRRSEEFVVSYIGALGFANGLEYLLECASASQQAALPVRFIICGKGAIEQTLKVWAQHHQLENLTFLPFANREGVRELLRKSDAVLVCFKPVPILQTGAPHKYFDGLAAGKLILTNFGGWIKQEIEDASCGIALDSQDPASFVTSLMPLLSNRQLVITCQQNAHRLAQQKYAREKLALEFTEIVERSVAAKRPPAR